MKIVNGFYSLTFYRKNPHHRRLARLWIGLYLELYTL